MELNVPTAKDLEIEVAVSEDLEVSYGGNYLAFQALSSEELSGR
jgi:hypothetical protein